MGNKTSHSLLACNSQGAMRPPRHDHWGRGEAEVLVGYLCRHNTVSRQKLSALVKSV